MLTLNIHSLPQICDPEFYFRSLILFASGIACGHRFHCKNLFFIMEFVMLAARKYYFYFDFIIVFV